jgi:hypothetical protein
MIGVHLIRALLSFPIAALAGRLESLALAIAGMKHVESEIFITPLGYIVAVNGKNLGTFATIEEAEVKLTFHQGIAIDLVRDAEAAAVEEYVAEQAATLGEAK